MADLATQDVVAAGTAPTFDPAGAGGDTAEIGSGTNTFVVVKNGGGSPINVTIPSDLTLESGADYPDKVVSVTNGGEAWIPLIKDYSDDAAGTGRATLTYSDTTSVTVAVVRRS